MDLQLLTLEQKIGQVLCLGWSETKTEGAACVNAHAREIVQDMGAGAVILMGRNVTNTPEATRDMLAELQALAAVPLFVSVDQEGGVVNRFSPPLHQFPGNMALGAIADVESEGVLSTSAWHAERQAQAQARELRALGVNWNFAPVVDVNNNPDNPIIGVRSYGEDPWRVMELGVAAARGYQNAGILACAKHFPGHGDTGVDSHLALPVVPGARARLDSVELLPFRGLIAAGVGAIMTTHIVFPALDSANPATLSSPVLTGLLRGELGFDGLVITDCLEMNAIANTVGTAQGALQTLQAGADMVLICHTLTTQRQTRQVLLDAVRSGELPLSRLEQAVGRVLAAKRYTGLGQNAAPATPLAPSATDAAMPVYLDSSHGALEQEIARASITFVKHNDTLPLKMEHSDSLLVLSGHSAGQRLATYLQRHNANVECLLWKKLDAPFRARALALAANAQNVLVATVPREAFSEERVNANSQAAFVRELYALCGLRLIVCALREPYDLRHFPAVENYACTYGHRPASLDALADALFGVYTPTGRLPVTIPGAEQEGK